MASSSPKETNQNTTSDHITTSPTSEAQTLRKRISELWLALQVKEAESSKQEAKFSTLQEVNEDLTLKVQMQEALLQAYEKGFKELYAKNEKLKQENEELEAELEEGARRKNVVYDVEEMGGGARRWLW